MNIFPFPDSNFIEHTLSKLSQKLFSLSHFYTPACSESWVTLSLLLLISHDRGSLLMKAIFTTGLLLLSLSSFAGEREKCFNLAQQDVSAGGLNLNVYAAEDLCADATNAQAVIECYRISNIDEDGLGLNLFAATDLCTKATKAKEVTSCYRQANLSSEDGGLGLNLNASTDLCLQVENAKKIIKCFKKVTEDGANLNAATSFCRSRM